MVCALRLKQTWGFLNQASPLGGIRDPERDSKSPKGSELGSGFRPSHFPLGKSQWKCAFFFFFKSFFVSLDKCPATEVRLCSTWCFIPAVGSAWENCISRWWSSPWTDSAVSLSQRPGLSRTIPLVLLSVGIEQKEPVTCEHKTFAV